MGKRVNGQTTIPGNVSIAHRVVGDGDTYVVFIHGWMMTSHVFDKLVQTMDTGALRLCLVDLRGAGESSRDAGEYTLRRFATDVCAVIAGLGLKRPFVVGHSMGGQVAQLVAAELGDEISGLALINTVPLSGLPLPDDFLSLFRSAATDADARATILDHSTLQLTADDKEHLSDVTAAVSATCIAESLESFTSGDDPGQLARITAPTLAIATDDGFLPVPFLQETVVDLISNARLEHIPGPGHYPQVEATAETAAVLQAFFSSASA